MRGGLCVLAVGIVLAVGLASAGCIAGQRASESATAAPTQDESRPGFLSQDISEIMEVLRKDAGLDVRILSVTTDRNGVDVVTGYVLGRRLGEGFCYRFVVNQGGEWVISSKKQWIR